MVRRESAAVMDGRKNGCMLCGKPNVGFMVEVTPGCGEATVRENSASLSDGGS
jgi:hypothetical protein